MDKPYPEVVEVEPARPRRACRGCGADRAPNATYCTECKAARLTAQWRDQKRRHRARIPAQVLERQRAEADQRRRQYLRDTGWM